ncbi:hypothetical protein D1814_08125 [Alteromonas sp. BL110]|nr:hypothetical protein D1814_08125 [Alteromonas sp. BL110]RKM83211.1 hypothetical protein D7031_04330 [Alteromonas sp. BL110]
MNTKLKTSSCHLNYFFSEIVSDVLIKVVKCKASANFEKNSAETQIRSYYLSNKYREIKSKKKLYANAETAKGRVEFKK